MKALIIVDLQNDFMPGGPLGVEGADELAPIINKLMDQFPLVVATQDWHPPGHVSFTGEQKLWPEHCVQETRGAALVDELDQSRIDYVVRKGTHPDVDSYSAFFDNAKAHSTGLADYLKSMGADDLFIVGVATDYCVLYTALDALSLGFHVSLIQKGCRAISKEGEKRALEKFRAAGGHVC